MVNQEVIKDDVLCDALLQQLADDPSLGNFTDFLLFESDDLQQSMVLWDQSDESIFKISNRARGNEGEMGGKEER